MTDLDRIEALVGAENFDDLWNLYTHFMAAEGFNGILYGFARPPRFRPKNHPGTHIVSNLPDEFLHDYGGENFFSSPIVRWVATQTGVLSWSKVFARRDSGELTPEELDALEVQTRHRITAGLTISFGEAAVRARSGLDLMMHGTNATQTDADRIWAQRGPRLLLMSHAFHLKAITLPARRAAILTKRQREVLEWAAEGKSVQDIAEILGVTKATAEKHLRLARDALGADTTAHAITTAWLSNLILRVPPELWSQSQDGRNSTAG